MGLQPMNIADWNNFNSVKDWRHLVINIKNNKRKGLALFVMHVS